MKKICTFVALLAVIFLYTGVSYATGLLNEDFSYTSGTSVTDNGWAANSGTGNMSIAASGLSYTGLQGSGVGNALNFGTGTLDVMRTYTTTSGTMYASFMINATTMTSTAGDYFFAIGSSTGSFYAKVHARKDGAGIDFGLSRQSNTTVTGAAAPVWSSVQSYGTTHLIVVKYTPIAGASNDQVDMWIDPAGGGSEGASTLTSTDGGINSNENINFDHVFLREATPGSTAPSAVIDGIKVGTTWLDVNPTSSPTLTQSPSSLSGAGLTYITGGGPSTGMSYSLTGVNLTGAPGSITVTAPTNFELLSLAGTWKDTIHVDYATATLTGTNNVTVRLKSGLAIATYGPSNVANTGGGATEVDVSVTGVVTPAQQLQVTPGTITGLNYFTGSGPSAPQSYSLTGSNLTGFPGVITVTAPTNFELLSLDATYKDTIRVAYTSATLSGSNNVTVRLKSGLSAASYGPSPVTNAGGGAATVSVNVSGSVVTPTLALTASTAVSLSYVVGSDSTGAITYSLTGTNLSGAPGVITVTAPANFEVSKTNIYAGYSGSGGNVTVSYATGTLAATPIYVRLVTGLSIGTYGPANVTFVGGGATTLNQSVSGFVHATGLQFNDDFSYTPGNLAGQGGWVAHSGIGSNSQQVVSPGLKYSGYLGSNVGNTNSLVGNGEDVNHQYTNFHSGVVYASAMVNVTAQTSTAGDYFMHFGDMGTFNFYGRTFVRASGTGYQFGLLKNSGTGGATVWSPTVLNFNQNYLIVLKYTFVGDVAVASDTNDYVQLFINPAVGGTEPAADLTTVGSPTLNDALNISGIYFRQSATTPLAKIDGVRIGQSWADATPSGGGVFKELTLKAFFEGPSNAGGTAMENDVYALTTTVELHKVSDGSLVDSQTSDLTSGGDGTFTLTNAVPSEPYYIAVKSANTLETQSSVGQSLVGGSIVYDFTTGIAQAYTDGGGVPQMIQKGAKWCIYSGDVNQDGAVDAFDLSPADNDNVSGGTPGVPSGYPTDVNGDGGVDAFDLSIIDNNNSRGVYAQLLFAPVAVKHHVKTDVKSNQ